MRQSAFYCSHCLQPENLAGEGGGLVTGGGVGWGERGAGRCWVANAPVEVALCLARNRSSSQGSRRKCKGKV